MEEKRESYNEIEINHQLTDSKRANKMKEQIRLCDIPKETIAKQHAGCLDEHPLLY